jgi:hypothetical protein
MRGLKWVRGYRHTIDHISQPGLFINVISQPYVLAQFPVSTIILKEYLPAVLITNLGADYMDRASPVNRAEKCHENLPWAAK